MNIRGLPRLSTYETVLFWPWYGEECDIWKVAWRKIAYNGRRLFWRLKKAFVLDDNAKSFLAKQGYVIPYFTQNDLKSEDFVKSFIFYYYTEGYGADMSTQYKNGYFEWSENSVRDTYKSLFGVDMPEYHPTDNSSVLYENGNYKISVSNRGDGRYEFISAENVNDGMNVMFKETDSTGTDFGTVTFHLVPADNSNGYIITQKTN